MKLNLARKIDPVDLLQALKEFKHGNFAVRLPTNYSGIQNDIAGLFNDIMEMVQDIITEFNRIGSVVGKEGKIDARIHLPHVKGGWQETINVVNALITDLAHPMVEMSRVIGSVASGDLTQNMPLTVNGRDLEGAFHATAKTVNTMVDQLSSFASEVTRVAREVGTEGKLGGQADVKGLAGAGTWKELTENVNMMASNLTSQVRNIAEVTTAVANGDLTRKITVNVKGEILQLKNTINTMVDQLSSFASEVTRVAREVGVEGKLGGQAYVVGVAGTWKDLTHNVNHMAGNLTSQVRNIAGVTTAVANGDLSKKITVDAKGEIFELKNTINIMVDQLSSFAAEVTRVAREVGTEGKLGGQAVVKGVGGIWKDLTENVNKMAVNLTEQVRSIAKIVTAVAEGDLKKKLMVPAKGEVAALSETINNMIDTLATFAEQVTSVAHEVGVAGRLGGQASVPGASGTWKDLTDNVNQLAANLTNQVRAISKVARAVTTGDLSPTIQVEAQGEVGALKDIINEMIFNLKETTLKNSEQDWLKTNIAKITRILQGQKDLEVVAGLILSDLVPMVTSQHGLFYISEKIGNETVFKMLSAYAFKERKNVANYFKIGEGLVGQCAYEKERILLTNVPDNYIQISSGLGSHKPLSIVVLPVLFEGEVKAIIELGTFNGFTRTQLSLLDQLPEIVGIVLNSIETNSRTEKLLKQSQTMAKELGTQKEELKTTNEELQEKAKQLAAQNAEVAQKNEEVEVAKRALEEKAEQLALASKYKSEFLANMSHELRTPLNSLLLLSQHLATNSLGNLTSKQIEYAKTISSSGSDLLNLINDILDLSKIESGVVSPHIDKFNLKEVVDDIERMFSYIAENKSLSFTLSIADNVPTILQTDAKRLSQVLKNFLSNAYKFTAKGGVCLEIFIAKSGWHKLHPVLNKASNVIAFSVSDSGVGIPAEKQQIIFEAFQQVDGTTSRKYGGCGLGLSISREIAALLGGEITLQSEPGKGSIFTLYLSETYIKPMTSKQNAMTTILHSNKDEGNVSLLTFPELKDDRFNIEANDSVILIFQGLSSHYEKFFSEEDGKTFKLLIANESNEALNLAYQHPLTAVVINKQGLGFDADRLIKKLKGDIKTRHIPIHMFNGESSEASSAKQAGLQSFSSDDLNQESFQQLLKDINTKEPNPIDMDRMDDASNQVLANKNILIVDDDVRNIFAMTSTLEDYGVTALVAESGTAAIKMLDTMDNIDAILMDIMMPDMDGYEATKIIRSHQRFKDIPIIAITAKAMKDDCGKCIKAGASDYIPKPIHTDTLLSTLRLWLS